MPPTLAADLPTVDFGRWAARSRLVFPIPLNAGYAARTELSWEELLEVSDDRIAVRNARGEADSVSGAAAQRAARDLEPRVRDLLPYVESVLRAPDYAVYAGRTLTGGGGDVLVVGFGRGADGLVVVDQADSVRLVRSAAADLAQTVVAQLPPAPPSAIGSVDVTARTLNDAAAGADGRGLDRRAVEKLMGRGVAAEAADLLMRLSARGSATGLLGAVVFGPGAPAITERDAMWVEGQSGALLKRALGSDRFRFEGATRSALVTALIAALEDARRVDKGRR